MDTTDQDTWRQADEQFGLLMDLPRRERDARLAAMDLPEAVRQRIQRMLDALGDTGSSILDHPERVSGMLKVDALAGRSLGRWRLEEEIGRGGMAVVYRAVSTGGPEGQVAAVKILTLGTLAGHGSRQFLHEQQSLLRLRHPYIVPLLDAGVGEDGTPWLAMGLVEGERVDDWCDRHGLGPRARVKLVLQVCEALSHAHRNLVIHRDIKPSNVLVDEDGRVRLLDFGIAHAIDATAEATATATALRALTPGYASPEQLAGEAPTTAMDVYGLGALLHRLLTGEAPGQGSSRPTGDDLSVVVHKALAEAGTRYASVDALADDLGRWLDDKPVRARRPSVRYRLRKFVSRNKLQVAAAGLVVAVLAAGVATTLWQAGIARAEAERAREAAAGSEAQLEYLRSILDVLAPATPETLTLDRHEVVAEAARRAERNLAGRPELLASVRISLGDVAQRTGDYAQARALFAAAADARLEHFGRDSAQYGQALSLLGSTTAQVDPPDPERAESQLAEAVELLRRHAPGSDELVVALVLHATVLSDLDRVEDASAQLDQAAALCEDELHDSTACEGVWLARGQLMIRRDRNAAAVGSLERLLEWRTAHHGPRHSRTAYARGLLGHAYSRLGEHDRGIALLLEAERQLDAANRTPTEQTLATLQNLGEALMRDNRLEDAFDVHRKCISVARQVFGEHSEELALALSQYGSVLIQQARYHDAAEQYRQSNAIYRALYGPRSAAAAITLGNFADALGEAGDRRRALDLAREALAGYRESLGEDSPRTGTMWGKFGDELAANGLHRRALDAYDRSLGILRGQPDDKNMRRVVAVARTKRALALAALHRYPEALREAREAEATLHALTKGEGVYHGFSLVGLVRITCAAGAEDCPAVRGRAREALANERLRGDTRWRLESALAASDPPPGN